MKLMLDNLMGLSKQYSPLLVRGYRFVGTTNWVFLLVGTHYAYFTYLLPLTQLEDQQRLGEIL